MAEEARVLDPEFVALSKAFSRGEFTDEDGGRIWYRLFTPALAAGKTYPLVIFLHGAGERGEDNDLQVTGNRGAVVWTRPEEQAARPCYVLCPQAPTDRSFTWPGFETPFLRFLAKFCAENPVDKARVYLTGLSMGGMGTWHYAARYPLLFAAAAPICGAGDPAAIRAAKDIPFWTFHAVDDPFVGIEQRGKGRDGAAACGTRLMVSALRGYGAQEVRSTEYPAGYIHEHYGYPPAFAGHAAWEPAYSDGEFRKWLFRQDRRSRDRFELVKPGVWALDDDTGASYYLVEGRDRALAIDTGMGSGPILPQLRTLTDKPIDLAITHVHGDHMRHADEFETVYIPRDEKALLPLFRKSMMPDLRLDEGQVQWIGDGHTIDLGGGVTVEAALCGGHTPGSTVYLDHGHRCLFAGDAFGSGIFVLMAVPGALCLSDYRQNLLALAARLEPCADYAWFGGHRGQAQGSFEDSPYLPPERKPNTYNPPRLQLVKDMAALCQLVLSGEAEAKPAAFGAPDESDPSYLASYGSATMLYRRSQVK